MTDTPATPQPVWTPYSPEDVVGEFGWLWIDGPMGHEWVLVMTTDGDDEEHDIIIDLIGRMDGDGMRDTLAAEDYAGTPYLSLSQPTVEPGISDAVVVAVRLGRGGLAVSAHAPPGDRADAIALAVFAALRLGDDDA